MSVSRSLVRLVLALTVAVFTVTSNGAPTVSAQVSEHTLVAKPVFCKVSVVVLRKKLAAANDKLAAAIKDQEHAAQKVTDLNEKKDRLKKRISGRQHRIRATQAKIADLQKAVDSLKLLIADLQQKLADALKIIEVLRHKLAKAEDAKRNAVKALARAVKLEALAKLKLAIALKVLQKAPKSLVKIAKVKIARKKLKKAIIARKHAKRAARLARRNVDEITADLENAEEDVNTLHSDIATAQKDQQDALHDIEVFKKKLIKIAAFIVKKKAALKLVILARLAALKHLSVANIRVGVAKARVEKARGVFAKKLKLCGF